MVQPTEGEKLRITTVDGEVHRHKVKIVEDDYISLEGDNTVTLMGGNPVWFIGETHKGKRIESIESVSSYD